MNKCPRCGTEFEGDFCPECGEELLDIKTCPKCGNVLGGEAKRCTECGYDFYPPAPKEEKSDGNNAALSRAISRKTIIGWCFPVLVVVLILAIIIPIAVHNRHNGTYYLYNNGEYNYNKYFILDGNTYTDETGYSCDVAFDGNEIEMYAELFGMKDVMARGIIEDDILKLKIMGAEVTYAQNGHKHKLKDEVIKEATCEEEGRSISSCICGFREKEPKTVPALGHNFDDNHLCKRCGMGNGALLKFTLNEDESAYTVEGVGECKDNIIIIPNKHIGLPVTSIGYKAFKGCSGLTSITIPDSVTSIGYEAFHDCDRLKEVHITNLAAWCGIKFNGYAANPLYYAKLFIENSEIKDLQIPSGVTSIGDGAFEYCSELTSVNIPDSVTSIGSEAFRGCSGLTSVTIPDSVTSIGYGAFYYCYELKEVHITNLAAWCGIKFNGSDANPLYYAKHLFIGNSEITDMQIPSGVTSIGSYAFSDCDGLTSITIPDSVTSIGDLAFEYCSGLTELKVSPDNQTYHAKNNCLIKTKSKILIAGCKTSEIPDDGSVTSIGDGAFYGCSGLTSITIPDSVTSIGNYAFYGCSGLTSVTIGSGVTSIGGSAFHGCSGLTSVTIPDSVTSIGYEAFHDCDRLKEVHITNLAAWCGIKFNGYAANPLYYAKHLFIENSEIKDLQIPSGVTSIGDWAFYGCSGLTSVNLIYGQ